MPNMRFPSREQVAALRERYPEGTKIELIEMDEEKNPLRARSERLSLWMILVS